MISREEFNRCITEAKNLIWKQAIAGKYEDALEHISLLSNQLYQANQYYADDYLEKALINIQRKLARHFCHQDIRDAAQNMVLFYDGFGLESRGLAYIYLRALVNKGYNVVYVTSILARGRLSRFEKLLCAGNHEMIYIDTSSNVAWYENLYKVIFQYKPAKAFLYTTPYDVAGIMVFNQLARQVERYQINLTDHAFWLGVNAFDYCLEFRDIGASLSVQERKIPREKLLRQPYYPNIDRNIPFQGFPFHKKTGDYVVFSGGFLYKTIDEELTYYHIVEYLLLKYPQIIFWYAGVGSEEQIQPMRDLAEKYPGRVYHTGERKDLFQVMKNVDMYISTYPMGGGLMSQYAALAGKPPLTISPCNDCCKATLMNTDELNIDTANIEEFLSRVEEYINGTAYKGEYLEKLRKSVISENEFEDNLELILQSKESKYPINIVDIEEELARKREIAWQRYVKE